MTKKTKIALLLLAGTLLLSGIFLSYTYNNFKIQEKFEPLPLSFNPTNSVSSSNWQGAQVTIAGGFVKGKVMDGDGNENLLLRSLSPLPKITINGGNTDKTYLLRLENVSPTNTTLKNSPDQQLTIVDSHTVLLAVDVKANEEKTLEFIPKEESKDYFEFVILGDNRNGYQTFSQILDQVNAINPSFTIDNGDLVFGGEPNKYRLFYESVAKLQTPLYTTLGNHDIRENGRITYTKLFGPPYYSFDYRNAHFIFLDSSRGWAEKRAIPEEEYQWLERDLQATKAEHIFVISHIPPTDPRTYKDPNTLPEIPGVEETSFFEQKMNDYSQYKSLNHGFPSHEEATRFENLMSKYKVDTVFVSHIHSYYSYIKGGVRYVISGGGGAELLTTDSYYHYLRVKVTDTENYLELTQLPSPSNHIQDRYLAAIQLWGNSLYKEYTTLIWVLTIITASALAWLLWATRVKWLHFITFLGRWLKAVVGFSAAKYKELRKKP